MLEVRNADGRRAKSAVLKSAPQAAPQPAVTVELASPRVSWSTRKLAPGAEGTTLVKKPRGPVRVGLPTGVQVLPLSSPRT
jgi:hypothetical protein